MDLLTAVAVSMLPVSRLLAAAAFKELRQSAGGASLEQVLDCCGLPASSSEGLLARRDSVWDVAPRPDWKAAAFGAAYTKGAGERD